MHSCISTIWDMDMGKVQALKRPGRNSERAGYWIDEKGICYSWISILRSWGAMAKTERISNGARIDSDIVVNIKEGAGKA